MNKKYLVVSLIIFALSVFVFAERGRAIQEAVSLDQLSSESHDIYQGVVRGMYSQWNDDMTFIWTYVSFSISVRIKGEVQIGDEIMIKVGGGVVGDIGQASSNQVVFKEGEEAIVFLKYNKLENIYNVVRSSQGKYTVDNDKVNGADASVFIQKITDSLD